MASWWLILAETPSWQRLSQGVSWRSWLGLLVLGVFVAALIAISKWLTERDPTLGGQSSRPLFRELVSAHRLTWREAWLLKRVARAGRLTHPVHLFLEPTIYENPQIAGRLRHAWPRVLQIRSKLFAGSDEIN